MNKQLVLKKEWNRAKHL